MFRIQNIVNEQQHSQFFLAFCYSIISQLSIYELMMSALYKLNSKTKEIPHKLKDSD